MDPVRNPFAPGAGRRPPELAGRQGAVENIRVLLERSQAGRSDRGRVLHGLRGVGKTVLLNEFVALAQERGWIAALVEARTDRRGAPQLTHALYRALRDATGRHEPGRLRRLLAVFKAFSLKIDPSGTYSFGIEIDPLRGTADSGDLEIDLPELFGELGRTARELGVGAVLLIDEMQELAREDLAALNVAAHSVGQGRDPLPVVVIGAGLPSLPGILADATSYAERLYEYEPVGPLSMEDSEAALVVPARQLDVTWEPAALEAALAAANGYPYFVQTIGKLIWDYAKGPRFDTEDAAVGIEAARAELDAGLYLSRWERATPLQRRLLVAMARFVDREDVAVGEIAADMGRQRRDLSVARDQLIKKGLVYAPDRGRLAFTVPGMADYVLRQTAADDMVSLR
jgi:hypothetical protein